MIHVFHLIHKAIVQN